MRRLPFFGGFILALFLFLSACAPKAGLERPNGVALAADGSLYVMDFGNYRLVHAAQDGHLLQASGTFGRAADQIYFGWDLAVDSRGNLYFGSTIRDDEGTRHDGVKVFPPAGRFQREIGAADYTRAGEDSARLPYGVEVDSQDRVY